MSLRWHGRGRPSGRFPLFPLMKINVYIDGFNFYYAAVRGTPYKWLDLRRLCECCFPNDSIHRIKYFTAHVKARTNDLQQPARQQTYLAALRTIPGVTVHLGSFRSRTKMVVVSESDPLAGTYVLASVTEEKGSDVNLATELLMDGFRGDYEAAVVISDDSDLIAPVRAVRQNLKLPVGILSPFPEINPASGKVRYRKDLMRAATSGDPGTVLFFGYLDHQHLAHCLLPDPVVGRDGRLIHKPERW